MKHPFISAMALLALACACSDKKASEDNKTEAQKTDTLAVVEKSIEEEPIDTVAQDWDEDDLPMPISIVREYDDNYNEKGRSLRYIFFDNDEDKKYYTTRAKNYTTLATYNNKTLCITFKNVQEGCETGSLIEGKYAYCMSGLNYSCKGRPEEGVAFTANYMKHHEIVPMNRKGGKAPKEIIDTLQARYSQKVLSSYNCGVSEDGKLAIYSVQMRPKGKKCLGMRVVVADGKITCYEELCEDYNDMSAWHVDDGGEYAPLSLSVVTKGTKGYNIFYSEMAPESSTERMMMVRRNGLKVFTFGSYYNYIDYTPEQEETEVEEVPDNIEEEAI